MQPTQPQNTLLWNLDSSNKPTDEKKLLRSIKYVKLNPEWVAKKPEEAKKVFSLLAETDLSKCSSETKKIKLFLENKYSNFFPQQILGTAVGNSNDGKVVVNVKGTPEKIDLQAAREAIPDDVRLKSIIYNKNNLRLILNDPSKEIVQLVWHYLHSADLSTSFAGIPGGVNFIDINTQSDHPEEIAKKVFELLKNTPVFCGIDELVNETFAQVCEHFFRHYCFEHPEVQNDQHGKVLKIGGKSMIQAWDPETAKNPFVFHLSEIRHTIINLCKNCQETDMCGYYPTQLGGVNIIPSKQAERIMCNNIKEQLDQITPSYPNWKVYYKDGGAYCCLLCNDKEERDRISEHFRKYVGAYEGMKPIHVSETGFTLGYGPCKFIVKDMRGADPSEFYVLIQDTFMTSILVRMAKANQIPPL